MPTQNKTVALDSTLQNLKDKIRLLSDSLVTVQSDWEETDKNSDAFVKNKPDHLWANRTVTGNPIQVKKRKAQTAISTKISMEPIQEGSGDPSPTNVRPISGRTQVSLNGCGKNFAQISLTNRTVNNVEFTVNSDKSITMNGRASSAVTLVIGTFFAKANVAYTYSGLTGGSTVTYYMNYASVTNITTEEKTVTKTEDLSRNISILVANGTELDNVTIYPMVRFASSSPTYEPYQSSNQITISFGETVYGCTLYVETGELTINMGTVDLGTITTWRLQNLGGDYYWSTSISNKKVRKNASTLGNSYCSELQQITSTSSAIRNAVQNGLKRFAELLSEGDGGITITGYDTTITPEAFANLMSGIQFVYELATPYTIQLTPQQVQLLKGANTLWTDGDSINLTYIADEKNISDVATELVEISDEIAPYESAASTENYSVGDYMLFNGLFCKVISPIEVDDDIELGVNVTATTIGAELTSLNS